MGRTTRWCASRGGGGRVERVAGGDVLSLRNHLIGGPRCRILDGGAEEEALFTIVRMCEERRRCRWRGERR